MRALRSPRLVHALSGVILVTALAVTLGACGGGGVGRVGSGTVSPTTTVTAASTAIGADHQCIVGGAGVAPKVAWARLRNPILSEQSAGVKDQALVWARGEWHMLFSYVTDNSSTPGTDIWNIASATSSDLSHWSAPAPWPVQAGVHGVASPDIVRSPSGTFVVTYDSNPDVTAGAQSKLYYRTSTDLETWSAPQPLALGLHPAPGDRMIDAALAWTGHGLILGYKYGTAIGSTLQHFEIAWSPSGSLSGPWTYVGRPDVVVNGDTIENYEFVAVTGHWDLVATSNTFDQPWIFELAGSDGKGASAGSTNTGTPSSWLRWTNGRVLEIPGQSWDSASGLSSVNFEHANSVFLCDAHADDGYYYATYAGSSELTQFAGWGHAKIGIARSKDLVHWQVPG